MFINALLFFLFFSLQIKPISSIDSANNFRTQISSFSENKKISFLKVSFKNAIFAFLVSENVNKAKDIIVFQSKNGGKSWEQNEEAIKNPSEEMSVVHYIFVEKNEIVLIFVSGKEAFITRSENGLKWEIPQNISENNFDNNMGYYSGKSVNLANSKEPFIFMCINNDTYVVEDKTSDGECAISYDKGHSWTRNNYLFVKNNIGKISNENPFVYNGSFYFPIHIYAEDRHSYVMCEKYTDQRNFYCSESLFIARGYEISHVTTSNKYLYAILSNGKEKSIGISKNGIHFFHSTKIPEEKEYNFVSINNNVSLIALSNNGYINVISTNDAYTNHVESAINTYGNYDTTFTSLRNYRNSKTKNIYVGVNDILTFFLQCSYDFGKNYSNMKLPKGSYLLSEDEHGVKIQISNYIPLSDTVNITRTCGSQKKENIKLHYKRGGSLKSYIGIDFTYSSYNYKRIVTNINKNRVFNVPVYVHKSEIILGLVCPVDSKSDMMCFEEVYNITAQTDLISEMNDTTDAQLVSVETLFENQKITIKPKRKLINNTTNATESLLIIDKKTASFIYENKKYIFFKCECKINGYEVKVNYLLQPFKKSETQNETDIIKWKIRLGRERNETDMDIVAHHTSEMNSYSHYIHVNIIIIYIFCFLYICM